MSLLEDVFLEDEAGEAQDIERVIEGDEFDDRPRSRSDSDENSAKEDEAEEEKRRVDPTSAKPQRVIKNPRFVLNPARLTGPRGLQVLPDHFKDFKFKGKGHEKSDLDLVLKKLEHWAYRLYPKFQFEDCLKKIETLGKKRAVSVHLTKLRMDMLTSSETVVQNDSSDDEEAPAPVQEDEFDKLLQQQIEIARATPGPGSIKKTPFSDRSSMMPKATSSPSINDEQRERMLRNRRMAEERRLAKLKQNQSQENTTENLLPTEDLTDNIVEESNKMNVRNETKSKETDIIELDDNGIVTSPKTYVPAKKHHSSFDRNNSYEGMDSTNIVEIDDNRTKSPKAIIKKHNRSVIDSDDDEPLTIDVEKHHTNILSKNISNGANKPTDMSDDENSVEHNNKRHRSNIIDSSDDDEPLVMNESITVDIHDLNNKETHNNTSDSNINEKSNSETNELNQEHDNIDINKSMNDENVQETPDNDFDKLMSEVTESVNADKGVIPISKDPSNSVSEFTASKPESVINIENKQNENDEIMDVDFGDEF